MKRSSLFYLHQRSGARFVEHQGWSLPLSFLSPEAEASHVRECAGLADVSHRAKFDCKTVPQQPSWRLGKNHYLVVGEPPLDPPSGAIDVTSVYADLLLAGPRSRNVLSKLTSLNVSEAALPNLSCAQASLAHVHATLLREDMQSVPAFHLLVSREYGEAVWSAMAHAGEEFHLCPFGLGALGLLRN
jgi:glycine cleavage system aminomethyltransferase T